jgi:transposase-like protein
VWRYVYRAFDPYGQVIDVLVCARRTLSTLKVNPTEVVTYAVAGYPAVLNELIPQAWHHLEQYANNPIEADHSRLKHRLQAMRGLQTDMTAQVIIAVHAFMQNLRRGHYELAVDTPPTMRVAAAFIELAQAT